MDWLDMLVRQGDDGSITLHVPNLLSAALRVAGILFVVFVVWFVIKRAIGHAVKRDRVDRTAASFISAVVRYTLVAVTLVAILAQLGVDTTSLLGSLGIVGLTIGFAARDALSNIISGLFILWDRPFTVGDLIEIEDKYGRVDKITMRSTRVVTPDGKMLAIPNTEVVNSTVASYTNFPHLRLDIPITVGVGEDLPKVRDLLLGIVDGRDGYLSEPVPRAVVTALGDYNVTFELRAWIDDETTHIAERLALREAVFSGLREAGVHLPYETIELAPIDLKKSA
jgi:small conductance mechanosensitive channel